MAYFILESNNPFGKPHEFEKYMNRFRTNNFTFKPPKFSQLKSLYSWRASKQFELAKVESKKKTRKT